jgi:hypothetical protein
MPCKSAANLYSELLQTTLEQSESYLDYRRGDFEKAHNRIFRAIANDVVLESEYGYEILFLHPIHLAHLHLRTNDNHRCHPQAYVWLLIKQAFVNNDFATFLERASDFLAFGRADTPLLWYATVIDLITLWDELALPNLELVRLEVASNMATWEKRPQKFSSLLCVCANTEAA